MLVLVKPLDVSLVSQETLSQTKPRTLIRLALNVRFASISGTQEKRGTSQSAGSPSALGGSVTPETRFPPPPCLREQFN